MTDAREQPELLERAVPLEALARALDGAAAGGGRLVLVRGEAGVGKTALLRRFRAAHEPGARVLWSACVPLFTPRPLGPLLDLTGEVGGQLRELAGREARPYELLPAVLEELRAHTPTIAVLEDAHWADEATLDLLRLVGRRVEELPAVLVVSYRDDEVSPTHPLQLVLGELASSPFADRITLLPLSPEAVATLAEPFGAEPVELYAKTGGNPFFVTEVLGSGAAQIPDTVRDAVLARAARLSPACRSVLEAVAVVPSRVELPVLEVLADDRIACLDDCLASGMLVAEADNWIAFRHELARLAVEEATAPHRRLALHRELLAALSSRPDPEPARIAHHAEAVGDVDTLLDHAPRAAHRAAAAGAHLLAAAYLDRALLHAGALAPERQADLYEELAYERFLVDQLEAARAASDEALVRYQAIGHTLREGFALGFRSLIEWFADRHGEAVEYGRRSIELLEVLPPGPELACAYANQAHIALISRRVSEAISLGTRAAELAARLGETATEANALNSVGSAQLLDEQEDGWQTLHRSLRLATEAASDELIIRAQGNLAASAVEQRAHQLADGYLAEAIAYSADRDLGGWRADLLGLQARSLLDRGRWDEAVDAARRALATPELPGWPRAWALAAVGLVEARRGEPLAEATLSEAHTCQVGVPRLVGPVPAACTEGAWLRGDADGVVAASEQAYRLAAEHPTPWQLGELAVWRHRVGAEDAVEARLAAPYALELAGEHEAAAAEWARRGCPYEAAIALAGSADSVLLERALGELHELGARPAAAIVASRLRARGVRRIPRGARATTRANPAGLTARELEVLDLLAGGLQNAEIATRLVVARKTVDHHVSAILRKLGVGSRREAAAAAARIGAVDERVGGKDRQGNAPR